MAEFKYGNWPGHGWGHRCPRCDAVIPTHYGIPHHRCKLADIKNITITMKYGFNTQFELTKMLNTCHQNSNVYRVGVKLDMHQCQVEGTQEDVESFVSFCYGWLKAFKVAQKGTFYDGMVLDLDTGKEVI